MSAVVRVRILAMLVIVGCVSAHLRAAIINVPDPGAGIHTIQDAIDMAAAAGDVIRVAPGTYIESINTAGKSVRLRATGAVTATIIDATQLGFGPAVTFDSGESRTTLLEGFTLRGASEYAVRCLGSSPTIRGCRFTTAGLRSEEGGSPLIEDSVFAGGSHFEGGAVHVALGADPHFVGCLFIDNTSFLVGGAVNVTEALGRFEGCTFESNSAPLGGGLAILDSATVLDGCTFISNEAASGGAGAWLVGGTPMLQACHFHDGSAPIGAAVYVSESPATFAACTFVDNRASQAGGALRLLGAQGATLTGCLFEGNTAPEGGAVDITDDAHDIRLEYCTFRDGAAELGAGIDLGPAIGLLEVRSCLFEDLVAGEGSALCVRGGDLLLRGGTLRRNISTDAPGAVRCTGITTDVRMVGVVCDDNPTGGVSASSAGSLLVAMTAFTAHEVCAVDTTSTPTTIVDCLIAENTTVASPLRFADASVSIINCTIVNNVITAGDAHAIHGDADVTVANSIIWNNRRGGPESPAVATALGVDAVAYSCIESGWSGSGSGNIATDPQFMNMLAGDYRIATCSPCRDAGDTALVPMDIADLDDDDDQAEPTPYDMGGGSRILGATVDIGAYEIRAPLTFTLPGFAASIGDAIAHPDVLGGDEILLGPGTWVESVDFGGKPVRLRGSGVDVTILQAPPAGRALTITSGEWGCTSVEDLTLAGGSAVEGGLALVTASRAAFRGCAFRAGAAQRGGALACTFDAEVELLECVIEGNHAEIGGGLYIDGARVQGVGVELRSNTVTDSGGGAYIASGAVTLERSRIEDHHAPAFGGGAWCGGDVTLLSTLLVGNTCDLLGGQLVAAGDGAAGVLRLINTTLVDGGAFIAGGVYNLAGGLHVINSVLHGNSDSSGMTSGAQLGGLPASSLSHTLLQGATGAEGEGVFSADPGFASPAIGDYRPGAGSALIDVGDSSAVPEGHELDLEGNPRLVDALAFADAGTPDALGRVVDLGAVEAPATTAAGACAADISGDGSVDFTDLNLLLDQWGDAGAPADLDGSGSVDFGDLNELLDGWGCTG